MVVNRLKSILLVVTSVICICVLVLCNFNVACAAIDYDSELSSVAVFNWDELEPGRDYAPGELIVTFNDNLKSRTQIKEIIEKTVINSNG